MDGFAILGNLTLQPGWEERDLEPISLEPQGGAAGPRAPRRPRQALQPCLQPLEIPSVCGYTKDGHNNYEEWRTEVYR